MRARRWMIGIALIAALGVGVPRSAAQDSLADAARKARDKKKGDGKPAKIYTDDDLSKAPAKSVPQGTAAASGDQPKSDAAAQDQPKADTGAPDPNGEKAWRDRFKAAREKLAHDQKELDILQRELDKTQTGYYPDPQKAMEQGHSQQDYNDKKAKIEAKQKEIDQDNQRLSDMEDDLRKAGGDSGWSR